MATINLTKKTPPPAPAKNEDEVEDTTDGYEGLTLVGEIDGRKLYIEDGS